MRVLIMILVALVMCGCGRQQPQPPNIKVLNFQEMAKEAVADTQTIGNHSWVGLYRTTGPEDYRVLILHVVNEFEIAHPNLKVTGWSLDSTHNSYGFMGRVYGLWIDHEPKKSP